MIKIIEINGQSFQDFTSMLLGWLFLFKNRQFLCLSSKILECKLQHISAVKFSIFFRKEKLGMSKWQDNELLNFFNPPSGAVLQRPWYCESQGACKRFKEGYVTTAGKTHKQLWEKFRKNGLVFYDLSELRTIEPGLYVPKSRRSWWDSMERFCYCKVEATEI